MRISPPPSTPAIPSPRPPSSSLPCPSLPSLLALSMLPLFCGACGVPSRGTEGEPDAHPSSPTPDLAVAAVGAPDLHGYDPNSCDNEVGNCYTVYAHADHVLYHLDLENKALVTVGPFKAPMISSGGNSSEDVITDLAVAADGTIYVVSKSSLYTADPNDGHVTLVGAISTCGSDNVALTFTPDGTLYVADYHGAFCKVDVGQKPLVVTQVGTLDGGLAISGDIVAVADGTMYGTAYDLSNSKTGSDNYLVKVDPATATVMKIGQTDFGNLFGLSVADGQFFGFTHDGSGHVVTIDPKTGVGTLYNTFTDPGTGKPISFAGAGVNTLVMPPPIQ